MTSSRITKRRRRSTIQAGRPAVGSTGAAESRAGPGDVSAPCGCGSGDTSAMGAHPTGTTAAYAVLTLLPVPMLSRAAAGTASLGRQSLAVGQTA